MKRRRPPPADVALFERTEREWVRLGVADPRGWPGPPSEPLQAAWALVEASALEPEELAVIDAVAAGRADARLPVPAPVAVELADRWRGPIPGLRLVPLKHWRDQEDR